MTRALATSDESEDEGYILVHAGTGWSRTDELSVTTRTRPPTNAPAAPSTSPQSHSSTAHPHDREPQQSEAQSQSPSYLPEIDKLVTALSPLLRPVNLAIHDHPEVNYHEEYAHALLVDFFRERATEEGKGDGEWEVMPHAYGVETAFVAVWENRVGEDGAGGVKGKGKGKQVVVSFNVEYDALPGIGHACGHNLICVASLAGALATQKIMQTHKIPGKIVVFGTPAEEGGGGKIKLLKAGAYSDHKVDVNLISHPGIVPDTALMRTAAFTSFDVEYYGKEAHAAAAPWQGINALDALITAYNALSVLRQQTQPGDIIQGRISDGGLKPNIIHAHAAGQFVVRSTTRARREALKARVLRCFEAGAAATGATLKITPTGSYDDHVPNHAMGARYLRHFNALGGRIEENQDLDEIHGATNASTDQGNISYAMPSLSPGFWVRSEGPDGEQLGGPHTPDFAKAARTEEAHAKAMMVGKALAATAIDILTVEGLLGSVKREFELLKEKEINP